MPKITITSFPYSKDTPEYDGKTTMLFDVRTMVRNPWKFKELRKLDGRDEAVQAVLLGCGRSKNSIQYYKNLIIDCPNKPNILIGCQRGRYQSVAVAEILGKQLKDDGYEVVINHLGLKEK